MRIKCWFYLILLSYAPLRSQDLHFTMNDFAPAYFNPANTGAFSGTYRISGLYRNQNRAFFGTSFQTPALHVDSPFMFGWKKNHWIGGGIAIYQDRAGIHDYRSTGISGSLAYHIGFNQSMTQVMTFGVSYGHVGLRINDAEGTFADEIANGILTSRQPTSEDRQLLQNFTGGYNNLALGITFKSPLTKTTTLELGMSAFHLLRGEFSFSSSSQSNTMNLKTNVHAILRLQLSKQVSLNPAFYYSNQSFTNNTMVQCLADFQLKQNNKRKPKNENPIQLTSGVGYRLGDALQLIAGITVKGYKVHLAYDIAVGEYSEFTRNGAIEVGCQYIIRIAKNPTVKPIILCPRL